MTPPPPEVRLTLYVAGSSARSESAIDNLRRLCRSELGGEAEFAVVDVTRDPERAETARILTTPTVVRESPPPARRVTGDLSNATQVLSGLGLQRRSSAQEEDG